MLVSFKILTQSYPLSQYSWEEADMGKSVVQGLRAVEALADSKQLFLLSTQHFLKLAADLSTFLRYFEE
jgi:hypothetical protein